MREGGKGKRSGLKERKKVREGGSWLRRERLFGSSRKQVESLVYAVPITMCDFLFNNLNVQKRIYIFFMEVKKKKCKY